MVRTVNALIVILAVVLVIGIIAKSRSSKAVPSPVRHPATRPAAVRVNPDYLQFFELAQQQWETRPPTPPSLVLRGDRLELQAAPAGSTQETK